MHDFINCIMCLLEDAPSTRADIFTNARMDGMDDSASQMAAEDSMTVVIQGTALRITCFLKKKKKMPAAFSKIIL